MSGTPTRTLNDWLCSHGWICDDTWKFSHALSCSVLGFTVSDDAGARQHVIRNAWRAWCLHKHCQSSRRDWDLDCFDNGAFRRIDWDGVRKFAASGPEARAVATGGSFSPAVDDTCIWPGCHDIGLTTLCGLVIVDVVIWISHLDQVKFSWLGLGESFLVRLLTWIVFMLGLCLCNVDFGISGMALSALSVPAHVCSFVRVIFVIALFSLLFAWG